jgi:hypothetical protein
MELLLKRQPTNKEDVTFGSLSINGEYECHTLEDAIRVQKIYGQTCIPPGRYRIEMKLSPKFNLIVPHILDVPGFSNILIHHGNTKNDTLGCILVGITIKGSVIFSSRIALDRLISRLKDVREEIWINIKNP